MIRYLMVFILACLASNFANSEEMNFEEGDLIVLEEDEELYEDLDEMFNSDISDS